MNLPILMNFPFLCVIDPSMTAFLDRSSLKDYRRGLGSLPEIGDYWILMDDGLGLA